MKTRETVEENPSLGKYTYYVSLCAVDVVVGVGIINGGILLSIWLGWLACTELVIIVNFCRLII